MPNPYSSTETASTAPSVVSADAAWRQLEQHLLALREAGALEQAVALFDQLPEGGQGSGRHGEPHSGRRPQTPPRTLPRHEFAWESATAQKLQKQINKVAAVDSTLLLLGQSGTGKSTLARMIHQRSARQTHPFVTVNCASLPRELIDAELFGHSKGAFTGAVENRKGRVEAADGGTLFLDEIGDLPLELQPKLLTFLQERSFYRLGSNQLRQVDVRVISATHTDLLQRAADGLFRRDLFFRLAVLQIKVPSLAQRRDEIGEMARRILTRFGRQNASPQLRLDAATIRKLESYDWPGNIRELENVIENAAAFCNSDVVRPADLALIGQTSQPSDSPEVCPYLGKSLAEIEKEALIAALNHHNGNKAHTARSLGISLRSIYNKMRKHGLVMDKSICTTEPCAN